jgi:pimeloyl-ACP methyl ester carboxylesterase
VLVGGAFNDRSTVAGAAAALSGSYTALTYDRRGRGESGPLGPWPGGEAGVAAEIADLAAVVDAAGGDAVLVGHSSGAQLVLEAVARGSRRHLPHGARRGSRDPAPARGARRRDQSRVT